MADLTEAIIDALDPYDIPTGRAWSREDRREPAEKATDAIAAYMTANGANVLRLVDGALVLDKWEDEK